MGLPMVLKVPHLTAEKLIPSVCNIGVSYSLLGFGDILVPGLLISYCHAFDLLSGTPKKIYFTSVVIAYGAGLLITFMGLKLMEVAQPALLYLVPCTLIPPLLISICRKEFKALWTGNLNKEEEVIEGDNGGERNYNTINVDYVDNTDADELIN